MKKNNFKTEILHLEIPFFEWVDGDFEVMEELYQNYISEPNSIERIKRFIIMDYLTQLENDDLAKMFTNFKSKKLIEKEEERKRQEELLESTKVDYDDDMPF
ncbi:hypothetical protein [Clostridium perfringens]|uniref:hypothetical protein n=1 Tax=Clostridium perfringens TaxID=1502 RepID=UPI002AC66697|nr:hypothetical protein [Clostridium perfringens]MDZ5019665.1 hypothetical protein [Clostridium perfringens]